MLRLLLQPGQYLVGLIALWGLALPAQALEDLAGRELTPPMKVERIVLGEGRLLPVLALLEGDGVMRRLVGMPRDLPLVAPGTYAEYVRRYPELAKVPPIGQGAADTFSLEQVLALEPDLAVFSLHGHGPGADNPRLIEQMERAGITVVFVDFREQPLRNTPLSIELLGELLGQQQRAQGFAADYRSQLAEVSKRLPSKSQQPRVFLHSRAGLTDSCCETMARGMLANLLQEAGGRNIAEDKLPGAAGMLSIELLVTEPSEHYIASAVGSSTSVREGARYVALGPGVAAEDARASLQKLVREPGMQHISAIADGQVHALWHDFYNSPFNVVAVQVMAKWLYPNEFADLQPEKTLQLLHSRYQPVPLPGTYWLTL